MIHESNRSLKGSDFQKDESTIEAQPKMSASSESIPISVLILTKNEESDLSRCIESVPWCDDVHVLDSHSSDRTVEIGQSLGAKVRARVFDGYASQRNAGLHETEFANEWVLILDADEIIPIGLALEMKEFVKNAPSGISACRIRRRDYFMGQWLKHAQMSPFYVRLVRPKEVRYEREVNEVLTTDGEIHNLQEPFDHYPFSKGISHWVDKHNKYSTMEAEELLRQRESLPEGSLQNLFSRDFNVRRGAQKAFFYRMPFRPAIKWTYLVIVRRAFLDGRAGISYATLMFIYEYLISLKAIEIAQKRAEVGKSKS